MGNGEFINPFYDKTDEVGLIACGYGEPATSFRAGPWITPYYVVHYIIRGKGWYACGGKTFAVRHGDVFISQPGELISYYTDPEDLWMYCWVQVTGRLVEQSFQAIGMDRDHLVFRQTNTAFMDSVVGILDYTSDKRENYSQLRINAYVLEALSGLDESANFPSNAANKRKKYIQTAKAFIEFHSKDAPVGVDDIAHHLGLERSYFYRVFKEETGYSPQEYLLKFRISKAKKLLAKGVRPNEVCAACGFADIYYFGKAFKKSTGLTPSQYRADHKPKPGESANKSEQPAESKTDHEETAPS